MADENAVKNYGAGNIKVLEGLEGVRRRFDVIELSRKIKEGKIEIKINVNLK